MAAGGAPIAKAPESSSSVDRSSTERCCASRSAIQQAPVKGRLAFMAMLVLFHVPMLVFLVAVPAFLERQCRCRVRSLDDDARDVVAEGLERAVQPGQQAEAVHRYDVGLGNRQEVARRELERVGLDTGSVVTSTRSPPLRSAKYCIG